MLSLRQPGGHECLALPEFFNTARPRSADGGNAERPSTLVIASSGVIHSHLAMFAIPLVTAALVDQFEGRQAATLSPDAHSIGERVHSA